MQRPLLLSGFMATGKSAVGRALAERRGAPFVDLDATIEARAGMSVAAFFADRGEAAFRTLETEILLETLESASSNPAPVVALGGGALLDRARRIDVLGRAVVVTLTAEPEEVARRAAQQGGIAKRPLLVGADPVARIEALLAARELSYLESHAQIRTDGRSLEEIAREVGVIWDEDAVCVAAGRDSYCVRIGADLIDTHLEGLIGSCSGALLVSDTNVAPLHGDKARKALAGITRRAEVLLTPGEEHKNLTGLAQIFQGAFEASLDRKATFVGLGGGVVTDMTGFAAATWVRGVRWIGLPTTLLSMVDASVGGKTAVDFHSAKNSVGAFWQPAGVICDVRTLLTETDRMYVGALSEVVKTALIGDPELFALLEDNHAAILRRDLDLMTEVVDRCVRVKARVVALDERESGIRATLNLGHTIGHALEAASGFTGLTHGEAVSLGLVAALRLGQRRGHTPADLTERVLRLLRTLGLPHALGEADLRKSTALLGHDKKRAGAQIKFVYAQDLGRVVPEAISLDDLTKLTPELAD